MKPRRITKGLVDALKPGSLVWDSDVVGFGVRRQRVAKIYVLKTRIGGRQRWLTIGRHGPWTPDTARREARRILGDVAGGDDPASARDAERQALSNNNERRQRLGLLIAAAEFRQTENGLYAWDGLYTALAGRGERLSLPGWIRDYLMDCIVELNRLKFAVADRKLKPEEAADRVPEALRLRRPRGKKSCFTEYTDVFHDAALFSDHNLGRARGEKGEALVKDQEDKLSKSRRTVFERLSKQRQTEERLTILARKHRLF